MHGHLPIADAARRFDPTGTSDIRSRFRREMAQRWSKLVQLIREAIRGDANMLGFGPAGVASVARRHDPVRDFQGWLDAALAQVVLAGAGDWTQHYLDEAASRARSRAHALVPAMGPGQHENVHAVVASSAAVELQGVAEAVSQRVMRVIAAGLLGKMSAPQIARMASEEVRKVGKTRSNALVEMSVSSAFNNATLDIFKALGLTRVGIDPEHMLPGAGVVRRSKARDVSRETLDATEQERIERAQVERSNTPGPSLIGKIEKIERAASELETVEILTAGDEDVCEECQDIADAGPYEIDEARSLIPAHPNCRCAYVPFFDERFAEQQREEED